MPIIKIHKKTLLIILALTVSISGFSIAQSITGIIVTPSSSNVDFSTAIIVPTSFTASSSTTIETTSVTESSSPVNFVSAIVIPTSSTPDEIPVITTTVVSESVSAISTSSQTIVPTNFDGTFSTNPVSFSSFSLFGTTISEVFFPVKITSSIILSSFSLTGNNIDLIPIPVKVTTPISESSFMVTGQEKLVDVPTPLEDTQGVIDNIKILISVGDLSQTDGERLIKKLEKTINALEGKNDNRACAVLSQFIHEVSKLVPNENLSELNGDMLTSFAVMIQNDLNC